MGSDLNKWEIFFYLCVAPFASNPYERNSVQFIGVNFGRNSGHLKVDILSMTDIECTVCAHFADKLKEAEL